MNRTKRNKRQRKNRTQHRRKGGRIIGRGSFGCVTADPPIACPTAPTNRPYVSKLYAPNLVDTNEFIVDTTFVSDWDKAEELRRRIPTIDNHMILPTHECALNNLTNNAKASNNYRACLAVVPNPTRVAYSPQATGDLYTLTKTPALLASFQPQNRIEAMLELVQTLELLHSASVTHNDIHDGNIFYTLDSQTQQFKLSLADIGLARFYQDPWDFRKSQRGDVKELGEAMSSLVTPFLHDPSFSSFFRAWRGGSFRTAEGVYDLLNSLRMMM